MNEVQHKSIKRADKCATTSICSFFLKSGFGCYHIFILFLYLNLCSGVLPITIALIAAFPAVQLKFHQSLHSASKPCLLFFWPSWATSIPLLQCIIHEPPNSTENSPGDSRAQQCRTALGEMLYMNLGGVGGACDTKPQVSQGFSDLRVILIMSFFLWDRPPSRILLFFFSPDLSSFVF